MTLSLALACSVVVAQPPAADAPSALTLVTAQVAGRQVASQPVARVTLSDAPTTPGISFAASALTSFTGFMMLFGMAASPSPGLPGTDLLWRARLASSLLLLSVGPSVGDLLNHDMSAFLVASGVRSAIVAISWASLELLFTARSPDTLLAVGSLLFITVGSLVWTGWCTADLVRSLFAPQRWVDRTNSQLHSRMPIDEVRQTGGLRFAR